MPFSCRAANLVRPVLAQQARHQARHGCHGVLRQPAPLRFGVARVEQIQLRGFGYVSLVTLVPVAHLWLSDSGGKDLSLRQKPAHARTEAAKRCPPHPAAVRLTPQALSRSSVAIAQSASIRRPPVRTSRPAVPAIVRSPDRQGCSEKCLSPGARSPRARAPSAQTTDARGTEHRVPRSHGRSAADFYNTVRPHSGIGNLPPAIYARLSAPAMQRDGTLRSIGGAAPRPVAPPSPMGSN